MLNRLSFEEDEGFLSVLLEKLSTMSYSKKLKEALDEKYHPLIVDSNDELLKFQYIDQPDATFILDKLSQRETPLKVKEFMESGAQVTASGENLKAVFLECLINKARKSLEHIKRTLEYFYTDILKCWFLPEDPMERTAA